MHGVGFLLGGASGSVGGAADGGAWGCCMGFPLDASVLDVCGGMHVTRVVEEGYKT